MAHPVFDLGVYKQHFKVLKYLEDYNNAHPFVSLERAELVHELNIRENDLDTSIKFLEDNMLIETVFFMGGDYWTKISQYGIDEVFKAEKDPKRGTSLFPPLRLFNDQGWGP